MPADRPAFVPRSTVRALTHRALLALAHACYRAGNGALFAAAGVLRRNELQAASVEQYRMFNLSAAEVDAGLTPAEADFYARFLRGGDRVLLVGSGTGRDLMALHVMGYDVTGLEPEAALVEIARQHAARRRLSIPMMTGLIQRAALSGPFDACIFSNGCYSLVQGTAARVDMLRHVCSALAAGGRVIVSYHPERPQSTAGRVLVQIAARLTGADWRPEPGDTFARDIYTPGLIRYHHAFTPSEVARECAAAGLHLLADEKFSEGYWFAAAERRAQAASPDPPE